MLWLSSRKKIKSHGVNLFKWRLHYKIHMKEDIYARLVKEIPGFRVILYLYQTCILIRSLILQLLFFSVTRLLWHYFLYCFFFLANPRSCLDRYRPPLDLKSHYFKGALIYKLFLYLKVSCNTGMFIQKINWFQIVILQIIHLIWIQLNISVKVARWNFQLIEKKTYVIVRPLMIGCVFIKFSLSP